MYISCKLESEYYFIGLEANVQGHQVKNDWFVVIFGGTLSSIKKITDSYTFWDVNSCAGGIQPFELQNCMYGWGVDLYPLAKQKRDISRKNSKWS